MWSLPLNCFRWLLRKSLQLSGISLWDKRIFAELDREHEGLKNLGDEIVEIEDIVWIIVPIHMPNKCLIY